MVDLRHGDCLELLKTLPDNSVDMVLTDPPYGTTYLAWDKVLDFDKLWDELHRIIKPNCVIALFGCEPYSTQCRMSNFKNYKFDWIWNKSNVAGFANAKHRPLKTIENIMVFADAKPRYYPQDLKPADRPSPAGRGYDPNMAVSSKSFTKGYKQTVTGYPRDILKFKNDKGHHPTQKPVALLEYLIRHHTHTGETVLDFTMGSGSTGVACVNTGRKFIGFELDEHYFNVASTRISNHDPRPIPSV